MVILIIGAIVGIWYRKRHQNQENVQVDDVSLRNASPQLIPPQVQAPVLLPSTPPIVSSAQRSSESMTQLAEIKNVEVLETLGTGKTAQP